MALASIGCGSSSGGSGAVAVSQAAGRARVAAAAVEIALDRFRGTLYVASGDAIAAGSAAGGAFYERGGERHALGAVRQVGVRGDAARPLRAND